MGKRKVKQKQKLVMNIGGGVHRMVDATRDLVIEVKPVDVKNSRRMRLRAGAKDKPAEQAACCAAAVAIMREEGVKHVRVHRARVYVDYGDKVVRYMTPQSLRIDLVAFDTYGKFAPGEHILQRVPESQRLGVYRGVNQSVRPRRKRRPQHTLFGVRGKASNKPHVAFG